MIHSATAHFLLVGSGRHPERRLAAVVLHVHQGPVCQQPLDGLRVTFAGRDVQARVAHAVAHVYVAQLSR